MTLDKKIAIYARKSKMTETGKSIENQIAKCKAYAVLKFDATDTNIEIYHDDGKSGFYADRPEYLRMLKDVESGKISAIICYKFDRISRRTLDLLNLVEMLRSKGISFVSCTDDVDTSTKTGKILMSMLAAIAEFERDIIAERISDNMYELAKEGRWLGGNTPTGFYSKKEKITLNGRKSTVNHLEPIPDELEMVRQIYEVYLAKRSIQAVVQFTRDNGIMTKEGNKHTRVSIKNILNNPVYAIADSAIYGYFTDMQIKVYADTEDFNGVNGLMVYNKTEQIKQLKEDSVVLNPSYTSKKKSRPYEDWIIAVGKHKGIIKGSDWIAVQSMLKANINTYARPHCKTKALLSGILACPMCGKNLYVHRESDRYESNGEPRFLYKCSTRKADKEACRYKPIRGAEIDSFILNVICKLGSANNADYYAALERELRQGNVVYAKNEISSLKSQIGKLHNEIGSQVQSLRTATDAVKPYILSDIDELTQRLKTMESKLAKLEEAKDNNVIAIDGLKQAQSLINSFESLIDVMTYEEKLELVRLIVAKVYVVKSGGIDTVHIFFKGVPDSEYSDFFKEFDASLLNSTEQGIEPLVWTNADNKVSPLLHIDLPIMGLSNDAGVGERIRYYRLKAGLTENELANRLNVHRSTIIHYENNKSEPSQEVLADIAGVLGIQTEMLYDDYWKFKTSQYSETLVNMRKKLNLTQDKLAEMLNISRASVKKWEKGEGISRKSYNKLKERKLI
jgi:site-specific DNA recombinase